MQVLLSFDTNDSFDYLQIAEFTKECSAKWREMVSGQKKPFDDLAAKDKARYDKEVGLSFSPRHFSNWSNINQSWELASDLLLSHSLDETFLLYHVPK